MENDKMIEETETWLDSQIICNKCSEDITNSKCANCGAELIELCDYKQQDYLCYCDGEENHFCSQECVDEWKVKEQ